MTDLVAIRTHVWNSDARRLCERLLPVLGDRLVVVFHNRSDQTPPIPVIDLRDGWPTAQGLLEVPDWGWRCGDYFLYALRAARPGFDHYWLIEPDVHFTSDPGDFFADIAGVNDDLMGSRIAPFRDQIRFARGMPGRELCRATFALVRASGRAIDLLFDRRRAMAQTGPGPRFWPNDELFCFTTIKDEPGFALSGFEAHAPGWFDGTEIATGPDRLLDEVQDHVPPGRVLHPVRERGSLIQSMAGRTVAATAFLAKSRPALAYLTEAELDALVDRVAQGLRAQLASYRRAPRRRRAPD